MGLREAWLFCWEALGSFRQTGSVLPSSRALARALAEGIRGAETPLRVLEIGGGTGSLTREILASLPPGSQLEVAEINPRFADWLEEEVLHRTEGVEARVLRGDFLALDLPGGYDHVLSALPFNSWMPAEVEQFLRKAISLLAAEGTLSWFEYRSLRRLLAVLPPPSRGRRVREVARVTEGYLERHQVEETRVAGNFPPAVVHHLRPAPRRTRRPG